MAFRKKFGGKRRFGRGGGFKKRFTSKRGHKRKVSRSYYVSRGGIRL